MPYIKLTQGFETLVDNDDLDWLRQYSWYAHVKRRKTSIAYAVRKEGVKTIAMAPFILQKHKLWKSGFEVDHKDGDRLNNQKSNLRLVTAAQNQANQLPRVGTSAYKGVSWETIRGLWRADIRFNGKRIPLGRFKDEIDAARAYDVKAFELFWEYSRLNFPK